MGMPNLAKMWTREEVLALPDDGNRYELVDGELLVSAAPRLIHQAAADAKPAILTETLSWQSPGAAESLTVDLPEYFREVLAE